MARAPSARAISTSSVQEISQSKEMKAFTTHHSQKPSLGGLEFQKKILPQAHKQAISYKVSSTATTIGTRLGSKGTTQILKKPKPTQN